MGVPVSYASKLQGNIFCLDPLKHFGASDSALGSLSQSPADPSPRQDGETFWPCPALPLPSQDISGAAFYKVGSTGRVFFLLFLSFHAFNRWTPFTIGSRRQRKKNGIRRWRSYVAVPFYLSTSTEYHSLVFVLYHVRVEKTNVLRNRLLL